MTGNTVIDALNHAASAPYDVSSGPLAVVPFERRVVLVTAHRRESFGRGLAAICRALKQLADEVRDIQIVYPVHMNPNVRTAVQERLADHPRISLIPPLDYVSLIQLMRRSTIILTDSGGIQEEAPSFGVPVLVMRATTERPEAVEAGCARIVGTDSDRIVAEARRLLEDPDAHRRMAIVANPFGDGHAGERIAAVLGATLGRGSLSPGDVYAFPPRPVMDVAP
jgi:UDP-N-acetylglucosamine 2-epimerase